MISNFFLTIGYNIANLIVGLFPTVDVSTDGLTGFLVWIMPVLSEWNKVLPLGELWAFFLAAVVIESAILLFRVLSWIRPPFVPIQPNF
jgi:hypothetical protein